MFKKIDLDIAERIVFVCLNIVRILLALNGAEIVIMFFMSMNNDALNKPFLISFIPLTILGLLFLGLLLLRLKVDNEITSRRYSNNRL